MGALVDGIAGSSTDFFGSRDPEEASPEAVPLLLKVPHFPSPSWPLFALPRFPGLTRPAVMICFLQDSIPDGENAISAPNSPMPDQIKPLPWVALVTTFAGFFAMAAVMNLPFPFLVFLVKVRRWGWGGRLPRDAHGACRCLHSPAAAGKLTPTALRLTVLRQGVRHPGGHLLRGGGGGLLLWQRPLVLLLGPPHGHQGPPTGGSRQPNLADHLYPGLWCGALLRTGSALPLHLWRHELPGHQLQDHCGRGAGRPACFPHCPPPHPHPRGWVVCRPSQGRTAHAP
jgi:hypothetical protein